MGPGVAGLSACGALEAAPRWRLRLERDWGVTFRAGGEHRAAERERWLGPLEAGLRQIDFPEVTLEDRITYLEHAVSWQVRRALLAGRFDLALEVRSFGALQIAELLERREGRRPLLPYGVPLAGPREVLRFPTSSPSGPASGGARP